MSPAGGPTPGTATAADKATATATPAAPARRRRAFRLRTYLSVMFALISSTSLLAVGAALFLFRMPQIADDTRDGLRLEASDLARRTGMVLSGLQTQVELVSALLLATQRREDVQFVLARAADKNSAFAAVYQLDAQGVVRQAAINPFLDDRRRLALVGQDLSRVPHVAALAESVVPQWSGRFVSGVSGAVSVALGVRLADSTLVAEVPVAHILRTLQTAKPQGGSAVWLLDRDGEVLVDSQGGDIGGVAGLAEEPLFQAATTRSWASGEMEIGGVDYDAALSRVDATQWYVLARLPAGLGSPATAATLQVIVVTTLGSVLLGVLAAPLLAGYLARPLRRITRQARRIADGEPPGTWPLGRTIELNALSSDLERMSHSLQARERELEAIFNASPIGIAVVSIADSQRVVKVNDAIVQLFGHSREAFVGRRSADLDLWCDADERNRLFDAVTHGSDVELEAWRRRADGTRFLAAHTARVFTDARGGNPHAVIVLRDVTELRRIESEILQLNADLERRVQRRTEELVLANDTLSATLESLQCTQDELVRAEKLASLGALVAGIAHELNTPLGNGVMAVSTMRAALAAFHADSAQGLKRSSLERLVAAMEQGSDIAQRNLQRAAELVTSFKQVAADQTSAQRRSFALQEVTGEIVLTLRPLLKQAGVEVVVDVPDTLVMDSYPGALGQVLTNLLANAVAHAFEGHARPRITIGAQPGGDGRVLLRVSDNGQGIPPELLPRIFDPFVTTRMGRGGTGLGLHIVHNLVFNALGGSVSVQSVLGQGTDFAIDLPLVAPSAPTGAGAGAAPASGA